MCWIVYDVAYRIMIINSIRGTHLPLGTVLRALITGTVLNPSALAGGDHRRPVQVEEGNSWLLLLILGMRGSLTATTGIFL